MRKQGGVEKPEMLKRNILFQDEDKETYIGNLLGAAETYSSAGSEATAGE